MVETMVWNRKKKKVAHKQLRQKKQKNMQKCGHKTDPNVL